jgi:phage-related protein
MEVAYIAYHFHWSEDEILDLPVKKREDYMRKIEFINKVQNGEDEQNLQHLL